MIPRSGPHALTHGLTDLKRSEIHSIPPPTGASSAADVLRPVTWTRPSGGGSTGQVSSTTACGPPAWRGRWGGGRAGAMAVAVDGLLASAAPPARRGPVQSDGVRQERQPDLRQRWNLGHGDLGQPGLGRGQGGVRCPPSRRRPGSDRQNGGVGTSFQALASGTRRALTISPVFVFTSTNPAGTRVTSSAKRSRPERRVPEPFVTATKTTRR